MNWIPFLFLLCSLVSCSQISKSYRSFSKIEPFLELLSQFKATLDSLHTVSGSLKSLSQFEPETVSDYIKEGSVQNLDEYLQSFGGILTLTHNRHLNEFQVLKSAIDSKHLHIFKYLIGQGLSVDAPPLKFKEFDHPLLEEMLKVEPNDLREQYMLLLYQHSNNLFTQVYEPRLLAAYNRRSGEIDDWREDALEAIKQKDFLYIKWLIEERGANVDCELDPTEGSFIHASVLYSCPSCVKVLLKNGANPNLRFPNSSVFHLDDNSNVKQDVKGLTPLMLAVRFSQFNCVKELLKDPRIEVTKGSHSNRFLTPRALARKIKDPRIRFWMLRLLHAKPADTKRLQKWTKDVDVRKLSMMSALRSGKQELVEFLLHNVQNIKFKHEWLNEHGNDRLLDIICQEFDVEKKRRKFFPI